MNIDAVRSLLMAVDLGSYTAAASRLRVPPSTVSRRVGELETDLDRQLLVRTGRGVHVAEEALPILAQLRDVLVAVDACYQPTPSLTHLRVTAPSEIAISLLPEVLPRFLDLHPDVHVELHGSDQVFGLLEQSFDLAIRAGALSDSNYLARPLRAAALVAVAAPVLVKKIRRPDDLNALPTVKIGAQFTEITGRWSGEPFTVHPPALARVDSFTAAMPLVLAGRAWLPLAAHLAAEPVARGNLAVIREVEFDEVRLHALYPRRHRDQQALHTLIDHVAEALGANLH